MAHKAILIIVLATVHVLKAQDVDSEIIHFYSFNLDYKINTQINLQAGELFSFDSRSYHLNFVQSKLGATYRFNKRISMDFFYKPLLFKNTSGDIWYHRLSTSFHYRSRLFSFPIKNSITADWFFPQLKKYRYRFIYSIKLSLKNNFLPLRATPYLKSQLYYYLDGKPLNYWDDNREKLLARNAPNDFHRLRLGTGVRFRPSKHLYVSLYYIWQIEFNTTFTTNRQINILNKSQTAIKYPFNDYQVIGLSLSYYLRTKRNKA